MKYSGDTVSKPVVGREAEALSQAIKTGGYLANEQAWATIHRITEQIKKKNQTHETNALSQIFRDRFFKTRSHRI